MAQEETTTPVNESAEETQAATPESAQEATADSETQVAPPDNLKAQVEEYVALAQRTRAEFANYKKRVERELSESRQKGALEALANVLPIIDDFERAMGNIPAELKDNSWINGIALLLKKFDKLLNENDVTILDPVGEPFDPNKHEAIGMDDSDTIASGHVTVTLQKGYVSGDKVLRPALVRVAN